MNKIYNSIFSALAQQQLTAQEKQFGKEQLLSYIQQHPLTGQAIIGSPRITTWSWPRLRWAYFSSGILILLVAVSASVSYAAENSLPGDILYPIKISVNEEIRSGLAITPEAKTRWTAEQITRRLDEAVTLASQQKLSPEIENNLSNQVTTNTAKLNQQLKDLEKSGKLLTADDVSSRAQADLDSRKQLFHDLQKKGSQPSILTNTLNEQATSSAVLRQQMENHLASSTAETIKERQFEQKLGQVKKGLQKAKDILNKSANKLSLDNQKNISTLLKQSEQSYREGQEAGKSDKFTTGYLRLQEAQRLSDQAIVSAKDRRRFVAEKNNPEDPSVNSNAPDKKKVNDQ
ncbi:MAG: hypothetical protein V1846_03390 [Candidatus Komeilibacteria bacterium]